MNKFDVSQVKEVSVNEICFNNWNPKQKRTREFEKVRESIRTQGFLNPLIVREIKDDTYKYQILDGEQKFSAAMDLGMEEVPIYNLGKMSDEKAKQITIFMMQHVEADKDQLGHLLVELVGKVDLPYTDEEIELMSGIELIDDEIEDDDIKTNYKPFKVLQTPTFLALSKEMIKKICDDYECSENVALYKIMYEAKNGKIEDISEFINHATLQENDEQF